MRQRRVPDASEWTLQEGALDVLRFLARRAPWAAALWLVLGAVLIWIANLGATAGGLSPFVLFMGVLCLPAGAVVGMCLAKGLQKAVHFVGWVPVLLASAAAIVVVVVGALVLGRVLPPQAPFFATLVPTMSSIGAVGAVFRFTWAEA